MFKQLIANINTLARAIGLEMKKLAQKDGEIEEKIRRLSVGGRNLVLHTSQPKLVKAPERFALFLFNQPLIRGNTYTFTAKVSNVKGNTGGKITIAISKNEGTSNRSVQVADVPIVNGTLRHTFTASSEGLVGVNVYANSGGWAGAATGEHIVSEVMIEDGAYPSAWRPAIEDSSNGRNLLFDSEFKTANKWSTFDGHQISQTRNKGRVYTRIDITKDIPASNTPSIGVQNAAGTSIIGGKTYTLSLNIQGTPGIAAKGLGYCYLMYNDDQPNFKIPNLTIDPSISSRSSVTFVAPRSSDKCSILIGFSDVVPKGNWIGFHSVKLEEGSIATEWIPSIEDQDVHFNRLEKMSIGGRNYILNSKNERQATASGTSETFITYSLSEKLEPNTVYTLSGWVKATPNARDIQLYFISGDLNNYNSYANKFGDWTFVRRTFTTTATTTPENYVRVDNNGSSGVVPELHIRKLQLQEGLEATPYQKNLNVLQTLETDIQTLRTEALRLSDIGRPERVNRCLPFKQSSNGGGLLQVFIENHLTNEVGFFRSGSSQGTNRDILISTKVRNPAPGILPDIATSSGNNQVLVISFWIKLGVYFPNINDVKLSCIGNEVPIRLQNNTEWQRVVATLDMTKVTPKTTSIASLDIHIKVKDHASGQLTWRLFIKEMQAFLYLQKRGDGIYPIPAGYVHFGVVRNLFKDLYVE